MDDISLEGVRGVLTDLDNTIYPFVPAHEQGVIAAHKLYPRAMEFAAFHQAYCAARDALEARLAPQSGCRSRLFAFQALAEADGLAAPFRVGGDLEQAYWARFFDVMKPDPKALSFLARCKKAGIPVCLLTDMTAAIQVQKIARLGIEDQISFMVTSEEAGAEKPSPLGFRLALQKLGLAASEVLMIGDNEPKDIAGAKALGIKAHYYVASAA